MLRPVICVLWNLHSELLPPWLTVPTKEMAYSSRVGVAKHLMVTVTSMQQALIQTGAHTHTHTNMHIQEHTRVHTHTYIYNHTCEHTLFICPHRQMHTHSVYTYAHIHVCMSLHTPMSVICMCSVMNTFEHTHVYMRTDIITHVCIHTHGCHVHMFTHVHPPIYTHTYMHTHAPTHELTHTCSTRGCKKILGLPDIFLVACFNFPIWLLVPTNGNCLGGKRESPQAFGHR